MLTIHHIHPCNDPNSSHTQLIFYFFWLFTMVTMVFPFLSCGRSALGTFYSPQGEGGCHPSLVSATKVRLQHHRDVSKPTVPSGLNMDEHQICPGHWYFDVSRGGNGWYWGLPHPAVMVSSAVLFGKPCAVRSLKCAVPLSRNVERKQGNLFPSNWAFSNQWMLVDFGLVKCDAPPVRAKPFDVQKTSSFCSCNNAIFQSRR